MLIWFLCNCILFWCNGYRHRKFNLWTVRFRWGSLGSLCINDPRCWDPFVLMNSRTVYPWLATTLGNFQTRNGSPKADCCEVYFFSGNCWRMLPVMSYHWGEGWIHLVAKNWILSIEWLSHLLQALEWWSTKRKKSSPPNSKWIHTYFISDD